jgi:hypothetical protein
MGKDTGSASEPSLGNALVARHLRFGWWSLLFFLTLGIGLEVMHGFKLGWYLNVGNETRRLLLRLAHAHGTLLSIVHVVFGLTLRTGALAIEPWLKTASACLLSASILLPGGFFLGGLVIYGGDAGLGVLLVPIGALFLLVAVFLTARHAGAAAR